MTIHLDHLPVPARDRRAAAKRFGEFDAIVARPDAAGMACGDSVHGPVDHRVGVHRGGGIVCWNEPDGHHRALQGVPAEAG